MAGWGNYYAKDPVEIPLASGPLWTEEMETRMGFPSFEIVIGGDELVAGRGGQLQSENVNVGKPGSDAEPSGGRSAGWSDIDDFEGEGFKVGEDASGLSLSVALVKNADDLAVVGC